MVGNRTRKWVMVAAVFALFGTDARSAGDPHHHHDLPPGVAAAQAALLDLSRRDGPRAALAALRRQMETDAALAGVCHPVVHVLGRDAFERVGDFANAAQGYAPVRNAGYRHGVIGAYLTGVVGHGVMGQAAGRVEDALGWCATLASEFARGACHNGLFMELFNAPPAMAADQAPKSLHKICKSFDRDLRGTCFVYLPTAYLQLFPGDYAGAVAWCRAAPRSMRDVCLSGVGAETMKQTISTPEVVEQAGSAARGVGEAACLAGAVGLYINHYGDIAAGDRLCARLAAAHGDGCRDTVAAVAARFFDDGEGAAQRRAQAWPGRSVMVGASPHSAQAGSAFSRTVRMAAASPS